MPRLRHYDHLGTARFVTFCCYRRYPLLLNRDLTLMFLDHLERLRKDSGIEILGYVIMPEHVHLVLYPPDRVSLGTAIGQLKARSAKEMLVAYAQWRGAGRMDAGTAAPPLSALVRPDGRRGHAFWQRRCYDHNCRSLDTVREKVNYCHNNPVSRGLVSEPGEWEWSSYRWYRGEPDVPLVMDRADLL